MAFRIKPKEEKFFQFLAEHGELIQKAADTFYQAIEEPDRLPEFLDEVDKIEAEADEVIAKVMLKLNKTFITPFDREDIYTLAYKLDNVLDTIKGTTERMHMYNAGPCSAGAKEMAKIVVKCAKQVNKACSHLADIKKNRLKLEARCGRIIALEAKGDQLYRQEMAKLFRECLDPIELIKWKEILEHFEDILDISEDVAGLLRKVVLKYA